MSLHHLTHQSNEPPLTDLINIEGRIRTLPEPRSAKPGQSFSTSSALAYRARKKGDRTAHVRQLFWVIGDLLRLPFRAQQRRPIPSRPRYGC